MLTIDYLDTKGQGICEYDLDKLGDDMYYNSIEDALIPIFSSYADMLANIKKNKIIISEKEFIIDAKEQ